MARERTHTRISIPPALSAVADRITRRVKGRSVVTAGTMVDRAALERQKVAFARTAGILKDAENPDWETPEKTSAWVRRLREADQEATSEKLASHPTR